MATLSSAGLLKLEEQLTCPICLDHHTNPKILPCHHSFCQACLEGLPLDKQNETYYLSCPTCRQRTELPEEGARAFPAAFLINSLREITKSLTKKISDSQQVTCNDHGKPLDTFCSTCDKVICQYCAAITHKNHRHALVSECYPKHYQTLCDSLKPIKGKKEALKKVLSDLAEKESEVRGRGEGVLEEIHEMVEEMIGILRQSEWKLTEQAKRVTDANLSTLAEQAELAQENLELVEEIEDYVEQSLKTFTHQQVLCSKKQILERVTDVTSYTLINVAELELINEMKFELIKDNKIKQSLHHIGTIADTTGEQNAALNDHFEYLPNEILTFPLSIETRESCHLFVQPSSLKCSLVPVYQPIPTTVTTTNTHPGVYRIHCNSSTRGTYTVKTKVDDVQLEDKILVIPFNPYNKKIAPACIINNVNGSCRVAVSNDGHIVITRKKDNCVTLLNSKWEKEKSLGKGRQGNIIFAAPRGVAITPDNFILVSDNHGIQKISMDGDCIASVGEYGSGPLVFNTPCGIAISPITGQVYIADRYNHRIQVLNPDLTFSHSFGKKGSANGRFNEPSDIAIDGKGLVYVADSENNRIQKFTPDGTFITQFSSKGSGPGRLNCPISITIDTAGTGLVYVSEYNYHRVSIFTSDGVLVNRVDQFKCPIGITFDNRGYLYICDYGTDQLIIY